MRYIVQTVPSRSIEYLKSKIDNLEVYVDYDKDPVKAFAGVMKMGGNDAFVRLEDDIELTSDFQNKLGSVVSKYPDKVISFFTTKKSVKETCLMRGRTLLMIQCVYFPVGYGNLIADYYLRWDRISEKPVGLDYMLGDFLHSRKEKYVLYQPSLVQHLECVSAINGCRSKKRQSITYIP